MEKLQADKFRTILEANEGEIEKLKDLSKKQSLETRFSYTSRMRTFK